MKTRAAAVAITTLLALTLTACGSSDDETSTPKASKTVDHSEAEKAAGIPADPQGAKRTALLAALKAIHPDLVTDEDKAVDNARNQCSTITGGGNADMTAKARFSTADHEVTDAEATAINAALKATLCP
jgi:hypothetical protein